MGYYENLERRLKSLKEIFPNENITATTPWGKVVDMLIEKALNKTSIKNYFKVDELVFGKVYESESKEFQYMLDEKSGNLMFKQVRYDKRFNYCDWAYNEIKDIKFTEVDLPKIVKITIEGKQFEISVESATALKETLNMLEF